MRLLSCPIFALLRPTPYDLCTIRTCHFAPRTAYRMASHTLLHVRPTIWHHTPIYLHPAYCIILGLLCDWDLATIHYYPSTLHPPVAYHVDISSSIFPEHPFPLATVWQFFQLYYLVRYTVHHHSVGCSSCRGNKNITVVSEPWCYQPGDNEWEFIARKE